MRLAIVTTSLPPSKSGISLSVKEMSKRLIEDFGYDITLYDVEKRYREEIIENLHIKSLPIDLEFPRGYATSHKLLQNLLRGKFDIIHSHHYGYFPATAGFLAAKARSTPHVFTPHYHPPIYGLKRGLVFGLYHLTQGLPLLRRSDKVLPQTRYGAKILCEIGAKKDNMKIISDVVDTRKFRPLSEEITKKNSKTKILLHVSALELNKGAHIVFEIAEGMLKERDDFKVVFIGGGPLERPLKRAAKNRHNFTFLKDLPDEELIKWYNRADIFVLPSYYEAFGRVLAEAQACGTPCVATRVGGVREVVDDGKTGFLVNYGDWQMMKEKIEFLLDNEKERAAMGKKARKHVVQSFDTGIVTKKLAKVYESVS
jgi:glycosyltransferase involved in cell wall biosynthesis